MKIKSHDNNKALAVWQHKIHIKKDEKISKQIHIIVSFDLDMFYGTEREKRSDISGFYK